MPSRGFDLSNPMLWGIYGILYDIAMISGHL